MRNRFKVHLPYAPLLKKVKKSLITLIIKDFFYALHETKIANSYSLRLRLTDILNILLPAIGHQTYKVIYKKDNNLQSPNQKIPDRKTKCVIKTHINIKQNVIFGAKLKPV